MPEPLDPATVTIRDFLRAVFPADLLDESEVATWTVARPRRDDPSRITYLTRAITDWRGTLKGATHFSPVAYARDQVEGGNYIPRTNFNARTAFAVVLDDVGTKVTVPHLPASWVMETKPGCYQYGYMLAEPLTDLDEYDHLLYSMGEDKVTDGGATKVTQLFRVPGSLPEGKEHAAKLVIWKPEINYTLDELYAGLDVTKRLRGIKLSGMERLPDDMAVDDPVIDWLRRSEFYRGFQSSSGFEEVICPWHEGHTDPKLNTAGYRPPTHHMPYRVFHCFHEHCAKRTAGDFLAWVEAQGGPKASVAYHIQRDLSALTPFVGRQAKDWAEECAKIDEGRETKRDTKRGLDQAADKTLTSVTPKPQPEPEPDPEPSKEGASPKPKPKPQRPRQVRPSEGDGIRLRATDFRGAAWTFINTYYKHVSGNLQLICWQGVFYQWEAGAWRTVQMSDLDAALWAWGSLCTVIVKKNELPFDPSPQWVNNVILAMKALVGYNGDKANVWLDDLDADTEGLLAVRNGILDLRDGSLIPPSPLFFAVNRIEADWNPKASIKGGVFESWLKMALIDEKTGKGADQIAVAQETLGYMMSGDTRFQKAFMNTGAPRGGKGTWMHIIRNLMGDNTVSLSASRLAGSFPLQSLIGAGICLLPDVRLDKDSKHAALAETLLSLTGGDPVSVSRKHMADWQGVLPVRFMLSSNSIPQFRDGDAALASRFIHLDFPNSYLGREDLNLIDKLMECRDEMLVWAVEGYRRLMKQGHFSKTEIQDAAYRRTAGEQDPVGQFIAEHVEVTGDAEDTIPMQHLHVVFNDRFLAERGLSEIGVKVFGRMFWRKGIRGVTSRNLRMDGSMKRMATGLRWKKGSEPTAQDILDYLDSQIGVSDD